ncbi:MAG: ribosome small subunit-dependent GTPase A [Dehalococcoidia bacterium]|nr:ribosome small subunit-dependent GTPase A [Dehalococcoidia bacterium]
MSSDPPPGPLPDRGPDRQPDSGAPTLTSIGWDERLHAHFELVAGERDLPGRIVRVDRGSALAATAESVLRAEQAAALLALRGVEATLATGDWVVIRPRPHHATAEVVAVLPRTSAFVRGDPNGLDAQVLAANVDTAFIVHPATGAPNLRRIERELAVVRESGAAAVIVLTKADLARESDEAVRGVEAVAHGVPVHLVSGVQGSGVDTLRGYTEGCRTVALIGASGVGKSTLVNRLAGQHVLETAAVRDSDGKGRHTTTARHLVALPGGGALIDTPGMRSVAVWGAEEGVSEVYSEIEALAGACRFRDCAHAGEPGCAVTAAMDSGGLDEGRLDGYRKLRREVAAFEARQDPRARQERRQRMRAINRGLRQRRKSRDGE